MARANNRCGSGRDPAIKLPITGRDARFAAYITACASLHELVDVSAGRRAERDPDGDRDADRRTGQVEWWLKAVQNILGDGERFVLDTGPSSLPHEPLPGPLPGCGRKRRGDRAAMASR